MAGLSVGAHFGRVPRRRHLSMCSPANPPILLRPPCLTIAAETGHRGTRRDTNTQITPQRQLPSTHKSCRSLFARSLSDRSIRASMPPLPWRWINLGTQAFPSFSLSLPCWSPSPLIPQGPTVLTMTQSWLRWATSQSTRVVPSCVYYRGLVFPSTFIRSSSPSHIITPRISPYAPAHTLAAQGVLTLTDHLPSDATRGTRYWSSCHPTALPLLPSKEPPPSVWPSWSALLLPIFSLSRLCSVFFFGHAAQLTQPAQNTTDRRKNTT